MKTLVITGSSGFIGKRLMDRWPDRYQLRTVSLRTVEVEQLELHGVDSVIHLAGLAHQFGEVSKEDYYRVNAELSYHLALRAKQQGVRHFLYVSSTKVYGDGQEGVVFTEDSACHPTDDYGRSKLEAERLLGQLEDGDFSVSVVRPPLVYGPGVKGNLLRFMQLARSPIPLPFRSIRNNRAMVYVDNLLELFVLLIEQRASGVFLLCESGPISTSILFKEIRKHLRGKSILFRLPRICWLPLKWFRPGLYQRLIGSFNMDDRQSRQRTGYQQRYTFEEGIESMVKDFMNTR